MRLAELQQAFQYRVLKGQTGIESQVSGAGSFNAEARLGIYENAFVGRLIEALSDTYPALRDALGQCAFAELTQAFIARTPPSHFSVRYFGSDLSTFMATRFAGDEARGLKDLARLEWSLGEVFDAADAETLAPADLAAHAPETWGALHFRFTPALRTLILQSNAIQWWRATTQGAFRPARWRLAEQVTWAVWRMELKTYFRSLKTEEAWAVDALMRGETFASLCDGLAQFGSEADAPTRAALMLHRWMSDGWIVGIEVAGSKNAPASGTDAVPLITE